METWFIIIIISLCISALLKSIFNLLRLLSPTTKTKLNLPPGPPTVPFLGNFLWLGKSLTELQQNLRNLHAKYGPMVTLHIGSSASIYISDRSIAHHALVKNGAVFSDRPHALPTSKYLGSNNHEINSARYGPTWRLLRRNLTSEILHPSRVKSYAAARIRVLEILIRRLELQSKSGDSVRVVDHFHHAMFCLLVFMCFGDKVDENQLKQIDKVQRNLMGSYNRFRVLDFWPWVGKIVFKKRWEELIRVRKNQEDVLIPLIRSRKELMREKISKSKEDVHKESEDDQFVLSYVDTLLDLQFPDKERKLNEVEIVYLCSELLIGGIDSTTTALQWIMANMVKYPEIQDKLMEEINGVVRPEEVKVKEEDLQKMPYLKAVILEGLRRHPPTHFVLPHTVTEDVTLNGYLVPKNGQVNFPVAEMGWDPKVWEDPMEFKPERFLSSSDNGGGSAGEVFDVTCSREIKMMPFGAGRRICPAYGLAMLHLEYFVANLVRYFKWTALDGDGVDLSEKQEFTVVMKNPLQAKLSPRFFFLEDLRG